eukprot:115716_1
MPHHNILPFSFTTIIRCRRQTGWNHHCEGENKNPVYLNNNFEWKECAGHKYHPKTTRCGIFIDFQKQSFQEFVIQKYSEYFQKEVFTNLDEKEAKNQQIVSMEELILAD